MAKTKNATKPAATEATTEAPAEAVAEVTTDEQPVEAPKPATPFLSAQDKLDKLESDYKAKRAVIKEQQKTERKTAAIDLVNEVSASVVSKLVYQVGERNLKLNNFTIRFNGKADEGERVKVIVGAVRMTSDESKAFAADFGDLIEAKARQSSEEIVLAEATGELADAYDAAQQAFTDARKAIIDAAATEESDSGSEAPAAD